VLNLEKFCLAVTDFQFPVQFCFSDTVHHASSCWPRFPFVNVNFDLWHWHLNLTQIADINRHVKYVRQKSLSSKAIIWTHRQSHPTECSAWTTKVVAEMGTTAQPRSVEAINSGLVYPLFCAHDEPVRYPCSRVVFMGREDGPWGLWTWSVNTGSVYPPLNRRHTCYFIVSRNQAHCDSTPSDFIGRWVWFDRHRPRCSAWQSAVYAGAGGSCMSIMLLPATSATCSPEIVDKGCFAIPCSGFCPLSSGLLQCDTDRSSGWTD